MWVVTLTEFTVISKSQTHGRNAQNILDEFSLLRDLQSCLMHTICAFEPNSCIVSDNSRMNSHPHMRSSSSFLMYCLSLSLSVSSGCSNARKIFCAFAVALIVKAAIMCWCSLRNFLLFLCVGISARKKSFFLDYV